MEDFLSANPRRSELYDALDYSRRVSFQRTYAAFHGLVDEITDDEQIGYIASVVISYVGVLAGTSIYLFIALEIGLDWYWFGYCLACWLVSALAGRASRNLPDFHLQQFGGYSEELAAACVGQMKLVREIMNSRMNWFLLELLAAPVTAPCVVLLFVTTPSSTFQNRD